MRSAETELQNTIELPHTRPSCNRRTAEVDHRGSGTLFVWKNIRFRASAISQKCISCETSSKTLSVTPPPAPLAIPFTLREQSCSCKSQWNSVDHTCTKNTWHPIYNAEPIREWSENDPNISAHDPTTHETVSQPSHRRGRSSRFGDGLCMEKHRVSCICYLPKTHFVRDFLQNSIGNSSTSTTCNAIYIAGSILQLEITIEFHRQLIRQHHLQSHLHCGNNPAIANHNGILSTTHARKTLDTPFTMRNRSENDPRMIRTYPPMIRPHTRPSRNRRTAEVDHRGSGTDFVLKNIGFRASAISRKRISCETSSNCNAIYIAGSILQLEITMEFHRQLIRQHHLQSHLHCGNNPAVANHNGILSTTHTRKTLDTPFTMRNRSENDPRMIREWSEHIRP